MKRALLALFVGGAVTASASWISPLPRPRTPQQCGAVLAAMEIPDVELMADVPGSDRRKRQAAALRFGTWQQLAKRDFVEAPVPFPIALADTRIAAIYRALGPDAAFQPLPLETIEELRNVGRGESQKYVLWIPTNAMSTSFRPIAGFNVLSYEAPPELVFAEAVTRLLILRRLGAEGSLSNEVLIDALEATTGDVGLWAAGLLPQSETETDGWLPELGHFGGSTPDVLRNFRNPNIVPFSNQLVAALASDVYAALETYAFYRRALHKEGAKPAVGSETWNRWRQAEKDEGGDGLREELVRHLARKYEDFPDFKAHQLLDAMCEANLSAVWGLATIPGCAPAVKSSLSFDLPFSESGYHFSLSYVRAGGRHWLAGERERTMTAVGFRGRRSSSHTHTFDDPFESRRMEWKVEFGDGQPVKATGTLFKRSSGIGMGFGNGPSYDAVPFVVENFRKLRDGGWAAVARAEDGRFGQARVVVPEALLVAPDDLE